MKHRIGYACINLTTGIPLNKTCRLANASEIKLREIITSNLSGLKKVLEWNKDNNIKLFRISSDTIPFASHPVNTIKWSQDYKKELDDIGLFIKQSDTRVYMHPNPIVYLNSPDKDVVRRSIEELEWHIKFLDSLNIDFTSKVVFHAGGVYGNKPESLKRFIKVFNELPELFKNRLTLENDDRNYNVWDLIRINESTGVPLVFDNLHHKVLNTGKPYDEDIEAIMKKFFSTWDEKSGLPDIHYSSQKENARAGSHSESINLKEFAEFFLKYYHLDFDIIFETKDKDKSVLAVYEMFKQDKRFNELDVF
ncbi:MAG TPA: UV DNA damage repair endonuclease UvsE [Candidatus Gastranaerophilales bacterium]|nr:UV DNA damage repair endonuclease UvsE [Candidatus Gastranaerophilales bacterium]